MDLKFNNFKNDSDLLVRQKQSPNKLGLPRKQQPLRLAAF